MAATLSREFQHLRTRTLVTWTKITRRADCDECIAVQHETHGATRRSPARTVRTTSTSTLLLCHEHAMAWQDLDRGE